MRAIRDGDQYELHGTIFLDEHMCQRSRGRNCLSSASAFVCLQGSRAVGTGSPMKGAGPPRRAAIDIDKEVRQAGKIVGHADTRAPDESIRRRATPGTFRLRCFNAAI